jgi:hypothetical protein
MTRYIAVCKYEVDATAADKRRDLLLGLREIGWYLIELGLDRSDIETVFADAMDEILDEWGQAQAGAR